MDSKSTSSRTPIFSIATARIDVIAGLVSSTLAIPLAMAFGMFAFVTLGDEYFAYGAMAGLISAAIAGLVSVLLGDRSTRVYAPRITTTFFLGLLLYSLSHRPATADAEPDAAATLLIFFAIILLGGLFQALFGIMRLGSLIKFAPHPVMAGFQNMAAVLLFLVQLGDVLGYQHNIPFTRAFGAMGEARPLSVLVAALTFAATWNARWITTKAPPVLIGLGCGIIAYYGIVVSGFGDMLGPIIGPPTASAAMRTVLVDFSGLPMAALESSASVILSSALALAIVASIDALLCAKLTSQPGELRAGDDTLLIRLGITNAVSASFGGITNGINIGPSLTNRAYGGRSWLSVIVNAAAVLAAGTFVGGNHGDCHPAYRSLDQTTCRALDQARRAAARCHRARSWHFGVRFAPFDCDQRRIRGVHWYRACGTALRGAHEQIQHSQCLSLRRRALAALPRSG